MKQPKFDLVVIARTAGSGEFRPIATFAEHLDAVQFCERTVESARYDCAQILSNFGSRRGAQCLSGTYASADGKPPITVTYSWRDGTPTQQT